MTDSSYTIHYLNKCIILLKLRQTDLSTKFELMLSSFALLRFVYQLFYGIIRV